MVTGRGPFSHEGPKFGPQYLSGLPGRSAHFGEGDGGDGEDVEADDEFDEKAVHFVPLSFCWGSIPCQLLYLRPSGDGFTRANRF